MFRDQTLLDEGKVKIDDCVEKLKEVKVRGGVVKDLIGVACIHIA